MNRAEYQKEWRKNNAERCRKNKRFWREQNPEKVAASRSRQYQKAKQYITEYKLSHGCCVCGYNKCANALEFHHNGDKKYRINELIRSKCTALLKEELKKCIVLCANCHRELHEKKRVETYEYKD